jgi:hypothetical protein
MGEKQPNFGGKNDGVIKMNDALFGYEFDTKLNNFVWIG